MNLKDCLKIKTALIFLVLALVPSVSSAIIINSFTGSFSDGSRIYIDLKGYDFGKGEFYAPPNAWSEIDDPSDYPYIEPFDTYFYSSSLMRSEVPWAPFGKITSAHFGDGLYFEIDNYYSVHMTELFYLFSAPDWSISSSGVGFYYEQYVTGFMGGYFDTSISPYPVTETTNLMLLISGIFAIWLRRRCRTVNSSNYVHR
ncbi:hypothetical protein SAMN05216203_0190 [Marinobacter daqiaonensis]|uniref:Uncharacterized protein n=2 Tax=Marinobacter daqiaonensis TaxID=650891 RepID=A0A1I6GK27_9GAMM|nr:hypothetical protein SAMN05216203_0190 [Marinobacter daqiaonensis]